MSYTVLARKYRSEGFDDVVGQDHIAQTLKRAIESDRVAHAYLFCGTRGVGKTSLARILAKALNCDSSDHPTAKPCGKCKSCEAIARGEDMDVIEIDAASNTGVDNVRELIENSRYRPAHSRFKIYIIDEAHMLSKAAFNALLKILEEPPSHVKFILATTEPEKVLPTILSRCQRYDFRNIPTREIADHLRQICKREKIQAEDDALIIIAKAGAGSMRDALSLLDRLLSIGEKSLTTDMIEQLLGMPKSQVIFDLVQAIGAGDVRQVLESAAAQINAGMSPDTLIAGLIDHLRNLLILCACGATSDLVELPGLAIDELQKQADQFDAVTLSQDIAILEELRRNMRTSQAGRALFDATLVRLALSGQFSSVEELLGRLDGNSSAPASTRPAALKKNVEVTIFTPSPGTPGEGRGEGRPNIEPVALNDLPAVWKNMLQVLSTKSDGFLPLVEEAQLTAVDQNVAVLTYPAGREGFLRMLDRNGKKEAIRDALSSILNTNVELRFEVAAGTQDQPAAPLESEMQKLRENPLVRAVIEQLGGEIVKVESDV